MKRKIAVFTGNRAEYGLQKPIIRALRETPDVEYQLIASGAHLDPKFGMTLDLIKKDGFVVHAMPDIFLQRDDLASTARAIGHGIIEMVNVYQELTPELVVVYADRFEGFAAIIAASQMNIPVAHVEGGDLTEGGALDDSVRHAMTKLSHLHFATNEDAKRRILALGEEPWRVHNFGLPALDMINAGEFASPEEIVAKFGLDLSRPVGVFTQHSVTTEFTDVDEQFAPSLRALRRLAAEGGQFLLTFPNNDAGGLKIIQQLEKLLKENIPGLQVHPSLGSYFYYGMLALSRTEVPMVCVGNSSSGIKETPAFGCPTVNVGTRQLGRLRGENVIDTDYDEEKIYQAIKQAWTDSDFRSRARSGQNPYGNGTAGVQIAKVLREIPLDRRLINKKMMV